MQNRLFIRLIIPISTTGTVLPNSLFNPVFSVVPLPKEYAKQMDIKNSVNFFKINEKTDLWRCRGENFTDVVNPDNLNCNHVGHYMYCINFLPSPSNSPSNCIKQLMRGNFAPDDILSISKKGCKPWLMSPDDYEPIRLQEDEFVVHGSELLRYRIHTGNESKILPIAEDVPIDIVRLQSNNQLEVNGRLLPAPIFQATSNSTFNFSSGIIPIVFTSRDTRIPLPAPVK